MDRQNPKHGTLAKRIVVPKIGQGGRVRLARQARQEMTPGIGSSGSSRLVRLRKAAENTRQVLGNAIIEIEKAIVPLEAKKQ